MMAKLIMIPKRKKHSKKRHVVPTVNDNTQLLLTNQLKDITLATR